MTRQNQIQVPAPHGAAFLWARHSGCGPGPFGWQVDRRRGSRRIRTLDANPAPGRLGWEGSGHAHGAGWGSNVLP